MLTILEDNEHKGGGDYSNYLDRFVATVSVFKLNSTSKISLVLSIRFS